MGFKSIYIIAGLWLLMAGVLMPDQIQGQTLKETDFSVLGNEIGIKSASVKHIRSIFRGKYSSWNNQQGVIIVLPSKKNPSIKDVSSYIYETSITGMQKFWLSQVFQGRSNPPVFLDTDGEIIQYVTKNPGAIGIIRKPADPVNAALLINIIK